MRMLTRTSPLFQIITLMAVASSTALMGCGDDSAIVEPEGPTLIELLREAGPVAAPGPEKDESTPTGDPDCETTSDGTQWSCQAYRREVVGLSEDFPVYTDHGLYVGQLVQGRSLGRIPEGITLPRGSGSVILTDINGGNLNTVAVEEIGHASVMEAANEIIHAHSGELPADFNIRIQRIRSERELQIALEMSASYFGLFSSRASFDYDESGERTYFLAAIRQNFYSLAFERPSQPADLFAPGVKVEDVAPHLGPQNPPVYVDKIDYGRVFFLLIESRESALEMEGSLDASFDYALFSADWDSEMRYMSSLEGFDIQAYAYGGDSASAMASVRAGLGPLRDFFKSLDAGAEIGKAKPLSWRAKAVLDDQVVYNGYSAQYDYIDCSATGTVGAPSLLSPEDNSTEVENGCGCTSNAVHWRFEWRAVRSAKQYEIRVAHPNFDPIVVTTDKTTATVSFPGAFESLGARRGWTWRVRARTGCGWGPWSKQRDFQVEPLNSGCKTGFTVYKDKNYSGERIFIDTRTRPFSGNFSDLGFNDKISSIKLHNIDSVTLYEHHNFDGRYYVFRSNEDNLDHVHFNDRATTWRISHCSK